MLTPTTIEKALHEIELEVKNSTISERSLVKFTDSPEDRLFHSFIDGVSGYYLKALPLIINKLGLKNIVELGNREGLSTLCIWDKLQNEATLTTIDILKDQRFCPPGMFTDPRVHFVFGDVCDLSIFKENIPFDIDFLFTDTIHYNFQVSDEFEVYQYLLADKALVAIDDIHINDKGKFFERIGFVKWDLTKLYHQSGWGLFLYERKEKMSKEERILNAYRASTAIWKRKYEESSAHVDQLNQYNPVIFMKNTIKKIPPLYKGLTMIYNTYHKSRYPNGRSY